MKILILSFYYPPDLSAGSFRASALVKALRALDRSLEIDVITTSPNRYHSLQQQAPSYESSDGCAVHRIALPSHKSGMLDQSKSFGAYALGARRIVRGRQWDVVYATSSRLMTAALGAHVAKMTGAPLYLDIRDLFTDTMNEVLARSAFRYLLPAFRLLERRTFRRAVHINVVSGGFLPYMRKLLPQGTFSTFTNGIDQQFLQTDFSRAQSDELPLIVYAGNIGEGQGLHKIIPPAAKQLEGKGRFRIIGDGGKRTELREMLQKCDISNVEMLDAVPREQLMEHYRQADVLFLHLNDYVAFRKVLPSKLFEYAATGKPILAGVAGYAQEMISRDILGAQCFTPCATDEMISKLQQLLDTAPRMIDRGDFCEQYSRDTIMRRMAQSIIGLGSLRSS